MAHLLPFLGIDCLPARARGVSPIPLWSHVWDLCSPHLHCWCLVVVVAVICGKWSENQVSQVEDKAEI